LSCLRLFFFFFFQAEDGIRDFHVTGVQTCALPIFPEAILWAQRRAGYLSTGDAIPPTWQAAVLDVLRPEFLIGMAAFWTMAALRSEERRVGKECRSRGATYIKKK